MAVSNNRTDTRIYVRGDKTINYGRVLEVMGKLSGSGFTKVALISEPYKEINLFNKFALSGVPNQFNNFSFGMLFSIIFHGSIFIATIFALPFVAKKPIELLPSISVELIQISDQMNIPYAPKAAKIIEKVKKDNKKLLSEQAPPKEVKQEIKKQVKFDNQKDEVDLSKSKKVPIPEKKQDQIKIDKSEAIPLPDKKIEKIETKQETEQQPSKEITKIVVEKEKKKN